MSGHHLLVEYNDGSRQWIKNACESEIKNNKNIKRICSYCNSRYEVDTRRWKIGSKSDLHKIILES
jgi:hypothetical protein